jgi:1-acyl-sn-glycerol-3-phosphate acyltransferase
MSSVHTEPHPALAGQTARENSGHISVGSYLRQIISLWSFFGIGLVVSPVCALLASVFGKHIPPSSGQAMIRWLFSRWLKASIRLGVFEISIAEMEKLRSLRGTIIAPNHPSLLDAVIILSLVPHTVCIMRTGLINSPFLGGAARLAGFVTNDNGPALIRQGVEKIAAGENLLIFPEGTRTLTEPVNKFKNGFALIAAKSGAPIQTVYIERESPYLSKGYPLMKKTRMPFRYRVHLGQIVRVQHGDSAQQVSAILEEHFRERLENTGESIRLNRQALS